MLPFEGYLKRIEETELPALRKRLSLLESGKMRLQQKVGNGPWTDATAESIARIKDTIASYEGFLAYDRSRNA